MFNVSALLLDDAIKPAMLWQFAQHSDISQGSVETRLRCDGIFSDSIIANFLLILIAKKFQKSVNI